MKQLYFIPFVFLATVTLSAQKGYEGNVSYGEPKVSHKNNKLVVDVDANLGTMNLGSANMLVLTPVLTSLDDSTEFRKFAPVVITGRNRTKALRRSLKLNGKPKFESQPLLFVRRKNHTEQVVPVAISATWENWMQKAKLSFREEISGCAACQINETEQLAAKRIFAEPYVPVFRISYITPEPEPVKQRSESFKAYFNFKVGSHVLLPDYKNNALEFAKVDKVIREIKDDKNLTITDLGISGYASPEGMFENNMTLSRNRAYAFASYLEKTYGLKQEQVKVSWFGEDWEGLRKAVAATEIQQDKERILEIIDKVDVMAGREAKLMNLSGGATYRMLVDQFFPPLRRNEYSVSYVARAFDVEEAKQILKTKPGLLSLNEMFLVAQTYPKGSKEFKDVLRIAAELFPGNAVANLNVATSELESGNVEGAIQRLSRIEGSPEAWNNLGVAYAKKGNLVKAAECFEKAGTLEDAILNKEELKKADTI